MLFCDWVIVRLACIVVLVREPVGSWETLGSAANTISEDKTTTKRNANRKNVENRKKSPCN